MHPNNWQARGASLGAVGVLTGKSSRKRRRMEMVHPSCLTEAVAVPSEGTTSDDCVGGVVFFLTQQLTRGRSLVHLPASSCGRCKFMPSCFNKKARTSKVQ